MKTNEDSLVTPFNSTVDVEVRYKTAEISNTNASIKTCSEMNVNSFKTRRSLRRSWNQLPRSQRNLIVLGIGVICMTIIFFLLGNQLSSDNKKSFAFDGSRGLQRINDIQVNSFVKERVPLKEHGARNPVLVNVVKIPQAQRLRNVPNSFDKLEINAKNHNNQNSNMQANMIANQSISGSNNVDINEDHATRQSLLNALQDPSKLPGSDGVAIEDFLNDFQPKFGQRQIFTGPTNERQQAVVAAFRHSWNGYKKYAWGHDHLKPVSFSSHDWFGLGLTIVDSLDTIYMMGLQEEFVEARDWVNEYLTFDINRDVNLFEVTIRVLGGLLSAYHLSGERVFLKKSIELGNRLLPCFLSPSGIPYGDVNMASMSAHSHIWSPASSISEVTTIQLEFRDLSRITNVSIYEKVIEIINEKVHGLKKNNGLAPVFIDTNAGTFQSHAAISLGGGGDSYYEYLLKQWIQTGRRENDFLKTDYMQAIEGVISQLVRRTPSEQHVYIGKLLNGKNFKPKMEHLTCYLPGTLLLGYKYGMPETHLQLAKDLLETCYQTYMKQPTQLAPEVSYFAVNDNEKPEIYVKPSDAHNLLRPEFIESLYYFYALNGDPKYQNMGWTIFQAFEKHTKVAQGYTSIGNVKSLFNIKLSDMMESFWTGETLKYFYLLFSDNRNEIDLNQYVFNTEAHLLPIRESKTYEN